MEKLRTQWRCGTCDYWEDDGEETPLRMGSCHRFPPAWVDGKCLFPLTEEHEYCREYSATSQRTDGR